MEYKVGWLVAQRVLHLQISGDFDIETVQSGLAEVKAFVDSGIAPVQVIVDLTAITKMPTHLRDIISQMGDMRYHPNGGWIITISNSVMLRFAGQIASVFLGAKHRSVATFKEAVETISHIDPGVADALRQIVATNPDMP
ncbi:MAG: hypothetical protein GC179_16065 [Anaerolineaceae bacterium]|nr:hypothetical protein [Anaerolineaceae bacterium]